MAQPQEFPFNIMDVAELLHLHIRRRQADSVYADCPICGDKRGKMNINFAKNLWRCNYCNEGGGMLALYGKVYGISNSEAYREICDTLQNGLTAPEYTVKELPEKVVVEQSALASPQEIHQTFSMLLELLTLSPQHRKHLQEVRGLTDEQIERLGYKSTPPFYLCRSLTEKLRSRGCKVEGVPGFYVGKDDKWTVNFNSITAGIIIPARGIDGMIRGAQIRLDTPMILLLMRECRCHILFCEEEEIGGVGAKKFAKSKLRPEVNYIVELDRRSTNDAVFYNCDNPDFTEFVCSFGFEENYGSFSDISVVAPYLDTAAVNISAGYFNEHRLHEMIDTYAMCKNVLRLTAMLQQQTGHFPYQERIHRRGSIYGAQTSLFTPMIDRQPRKCACKLLMPLPEETRLYMGQHHISYAPEYMMDRSGNLYMYLECLKAAVETEGVFACDEGGQPPAFSAVYEGTRFLQVYTYEEAVERLEQAEAAG